MRNVFISVLGFLKTYFVAIILVILSSILIYKLSGDESKPISKIPTTDYTKNDSELIIFKDSLLREYVKIESRKDSMEHVINNLLKENKALSLQANLLKFKQNKIKEYEKTLSYITDKNTTIDSALIVINGVVAKYPIKVSNK